MWNDTNFSLPVDKFCEDSTIHGLRHIKGKNLANIRNRIIWTILFLFMCFLIIWQSTIDIEKYLSYNISSAVTYSKPVETVDFPAMTLCSQSYLKRSAVAGNELLLRLAASFFNRSPERVTMLIIFFINR